MNEIEQIIRINGYIQRGLGTVTLGGKEIYCVAMDRTVTFKSDALIDEKEASDEDLATMFGQTFTVAPRQTPRQVAIKHLTELIQILLKAPEEERTKRIEVLSRTIVDYSSLTETDIGKIDEAYSEVFD